MVCKRAALFRGRHFTDEIIVLCVRWYLRYSLSYRDLTEIMCERNLSIDPSTIWRWVQHYAPGLNERIRRELKPTNGSWRTDETYVRVAGRWTYLYRAVDSTGATIDFLLSETRDLTSARRFFQKALAAPGHPRPCVINVDEILPTRPLSRSLNRSACLVEDAAVALFLISITSSSRITARLSDGSTLVSDSVPLMAHNARFKATKQCT